MRLKNFIIKHPPKKAGTLCKICALPKNRRAEASAALACGTQVIVVWRWLRYDQKVDLSRAAVTRHARNCLKIRGKH